MGDPAFGLETAYDIDDQVLGYGFVAVAEHQVYIAADLFAATVASNNHALDAPAIVVRVWADEVGVSMDGLGDLLCFGSGNAV